MTPEERALKLGVFLELDHNRGVIADEIQAAIEEERKACAEVVEAAVPGWNRNDIAAAIRARGEK